jgi:hypothetical protein
MKSNDDAAWSTTVFKTNDPGLLGIAKSLLTDAGIAYVVAGEGLQGLFPGDLSGNDFAPRILVSAEDVETARDLLRELGGA